MRNSPLVSFIVPYFNSGTTIQETMDSIFNQSYSNFDVWLINDGSTDEHSIEKLKDFEENAQIKILHQENTGPSTARNKAILLSNAEFFVFLDSDDLIEKDTLSFAIKNIADYDVLFGNCIYFGKDNFIKKQELPSPEQILLYNSIAVCTITKAKTIKTILFDEGLDKIGLEDWELWIHLFSEGKKFIYIDKVFFKIRVIDNSRTFQVANKNIKNAKKYIFTKHAEFLYEQYLGVCSKKKEIVQNIDYKIGKLIFQPYRILKKVIKFK
ncbi:MAG: glycosyltransferase family A protein [Crocinitomicaceae bacterium]